jgi:hypothetical protein
MLIAPGRASAQSGSSEDIDEPDSAGDSDPGTTTADHSRGDTGERRDAEKRGRG